MDDVSSQFPNIDAPKPDRQDGPADDPILLRDLENRAREVGIMLRGIMPEGVGFAFLMFTFGDDGWMTYASNAERADMIKALNEMVEKLEADPRDGRA